MSVSSGVRNSVEAALMDAFLAAPFHSAHLCNMQLPSRLHSTIIEILLLRASPTSPGNLAEKGERKNPCLNELLDFTRMSTSSLARFLKLTKNFARVSDLIYFMFGP